MNIDLSTLFARQQRLEPIDAVREQIRKRALQTNGKKRKEKSKVKSKVKSKRNRQRNRSVSKKTETEQRRSRHSTPAIRSLSATQANSHFGQRNILLLNTTTSKFQERNLFSLENTLDCESKKKVLAFDVTINTSITSIDERRRTTNLSNTWSWACSPSVRSEVGRDIAARCERSWATQHDDDDDYEQTILNDELMMQRKWYLSNVLQC
jgi:hypothetical protein